MLDAERERRMLEARAEQGAREAPRRAFIRKTSAVNRRRTVRRRRVPPALTKPNLQIHGRFHSL